MVQSVAHEKQVIMTTQSPFLIDRFEPEDILVVNIEEGASTISRLERQPLEEWLKEYSLGELWTKNVLRGNPEYIQPDDLPF
jgi:predicted ATPase